LRSTAADLLTFLEANLGVTKSPLAAAMAAQLEMRRPAGAPRLEIAMGWHVVTRPGGLEIVWHNVLAAEAAPENPCPACAKTAQDKGDHRGSAFEWHFAEIRSSRIQTAVRRTGPARGDCLVVERWANNALAVTAKLVPFSRHFNVVLVGTIHADFGTATSGNRRRVI
jgi:hypothetical protein